MRSVFIGMLLVFLNFNLDMGSSRIGLIPNFIGYYYMRKGLMELSEYNEKFLKIAPYARGMTIYSGICYAMDSFGISPMLGEFMNFAFGLMATVVSLHISYHIILGIKEIEAEKVQNLNGDQLYSTWKWLAVFSLLTFLFYAIPALLFYCILLSFVVDIYYLCVFNEAKKLFYEQNPER